MDPTMKTTLSLILMLLIPPAFSDEVGEDGESFGFSFEPAKSGCEIVWAREAPALPDKVPHYTAEERRIDEKIVQNFRKKFADSNRISPPESLPSRKDSEVFATETEHLNLSPMTGCMIYRYQPGPANFDNAEAPTAEEGKDMARKLLVELGFDVSEVSFDRVRYTSGTHTRFDRRLGRAVTKRDHAGVFIPRLYEGVPASESGFQVNYGWGGELLEFSMCWREVKIAGQRKIPSREEIARLIQQGRSTTSTDRAQNASRLTIDRLLIHYEEAEPFRVPTTVEPMLFLGGKAEANGREADFSMYLKLP